MRGFEGTLDGQEMCNELYPLTLALSPATSTVGVGRSRAGERGLCLRFASLVLCLLVLAVAGCSNSDETDTLGIKSVRSFLLPPDGHMITAPRAVNVGPNNEIYVLDDNGRVCVFGDQNELIAQWRMPNNDVGNPEGVCFLKDGRIVVADTHYDRLVFFARDGEVLKTLGKHGTEPGQFVYPVAVCQDDDEFIYVAEYGDHQRVQKFASDGEFVLQFGTQGTEPGQFQRPSGVIWQDGQVFVADAFNNRLHVFKDDGTFVKVLDDRTNELEYPYDITKAPDGTLYVVEHKAGRVSHLSGEGELLGRFGKRGRSKGEFITPWGICFRGQSRIVVADTGNRRVVEIEL